MIVLCDISTSGHLQRLLAVNHTIYCYKANYNTFMYKWGLLITELTDSGMQHHWSTVSEHTCPPYKCLICTTFYYQIYLHIFKSCVLQGVLADQRVVCAIRHLHQGHPPSDPRSECWLWLSDRWRGRCLERLLLWESAASPVGRTKKTTGFSSASWVICVLARVGPQQKHTESHRQEKKTWAGERRDKKQNIQAEASPSFLPSLWSS